jgi:uncharacterized HAD superfamily protein
MVNEYFTILRRLVYDLDIIKDPDIRRQQVTLCIFQSVTAVETFLNIYFRVVVSEKEFKHHEGYFLKTIIDRRSLDYKLKQWPKTILGRELILDAGIGKSFVKLKNLRNSLMHFVSTHETVRFLNMEIQGEVNIDHFQNLSIEDAHNALEVAEDFLCEIFRLRGIKESQFHYMLRLWSAKAPA